ncbi:hypothetical protein [Burkholderia guangdongensis]|uniref:hypothetical protein n=1 Tax=Burkholderia guangdongensis TaxID=1792500 RepID=UPI0015C7D28E|nr:hypothetical protein [Burkholderia guangdongensis]
MPDWARRRRNGVLRTVGLIALIAGLGGCGGSAPLFTSDGRSTTLVQCTGDSWNDCTANAQSICNGDIDVIQRSADGNVRSLLFACKKKSGY